MSQEQKTNRAIESPDEATQKVIEDLRKEGNEFEGLESEPKSNNEEPPKPNPDDLLKTALAKESDKVSEEEKSLIKSQKDKLSDEDKTKFGELLEEKTPKEEEPENREIRIPEWKIQMDKRREKQKQEKDEELRENINNLTKEIEELKKTKLPEPKKDNKAEHPVDKKLVEIKEKYKDVVDPELIDDIFSAIPRETPKFELPKELTERLDSLEGLKKAKDQELEDFRYSEGFKEKVVPFIKQEFPYAKDEDIKAIETKLKEHYFDERYINLTLKEIYFLKKQELDKEISPADEKGGELGKKGILRGGKMIDPEEISDEEFAKLPQEEQQKVIDYKTAKERS